MLCQEEHVPTLTSPTFTYCQCIIVRSHLDSKGKIEAVMAAAEHHGGACYTEDASNEPQGQPEQAGQQGHRTASHPQRHQWLPLLPLYLRLLHVCAPEEKCACVTPPVCTLSTTSMQVSSREAPGLCSICPGGRNLAVGWLLIHVQRKAGHSICPHCQHPEGYFIWLGAQAMQYGGLPRHVP